MKYSKLSRFHLTDFLEQRQSVIISGQEFTHITKVLRMRVGDKCRIFNGQNGEYQAQITNINKTEVTLQIEQLLRPPTKDLKNCSIAIGIIKPDSLKLAISSLCALGVKNIYPIIFARGQYKGVNLAKLKQIALQAACQSEAMELTEINEAITLNDFIAQISSQYSKVYFADEEHQGSDIKQVKTTNQVSKVAIIGPEGGITEEERQAIKNLSNCQPVSLGARVMRSELAAIYISSIL